MSTWTEDQLRAVDRTKELRISTRRSDGTMRPAVPIWVVRVGNGLYIRSYKGSGGAWFRHATEQGAAHISAGNVDSDVTVALAGTSERDAVDQAYRAKYSRYGHAYVDPMTADMAAGTTIQITPVS